MGDRQEDVIAITDVECYRLDKQTFEGVLLARPEIAIGLSEKLAERRMALVAAREGLDEAPRTGCLGASEDPRRDSHLLRTGMTATGDSIGVTA
jgi:CRP-like cAMP-binding protein